MGAFPRALDTGCPIFPGLIGSFKLLTGLIGQELWDSPYILRIL